MADKEKKGRREIQKFEYLIRRKFGADFFGAEEKWNFGADLIWCSWIVFKFVTDFIWRSEKNIKFSVDLIWRN